MTLEIGTEGTDELGPSPAQVRAIADRLRKDYDAFPEDQGYEFYAPDVLFVDPLNKFRGRDRFQEMIGFMARWFRQLRLTLHRLEYPTPTTIRTYWTLSWVAPLPWEPFLSVSGHSDYQINGAGKIVAHIDTWQETRWQVVTQLFRRSRARGTTPNP